MWVREFVFYSERRKDVDRSEVLTPVKIHNVVFWFMAPRSLVVGTNVSEERIASIFRVEVGGSIFLEDVDTHLPDYTVI
jgi:hypothetical protein